MASSHLISANEEQPISRTYQYRKVMKPMLERKRRARINRCLDELKELLVGALQSEGESVSRLEKADVLELTVRHLHKLRRSHQLSESSAGERFRSGFAHCAQEVGKFLSQVPPQTCEPAVSQRLVAHLDNCVRSIEPTPVNLNNLNVNCPMTIQMSPTSSQLSQIPSTNRGLNVLTQFTPPSSPISSPTYLQHHKLFALENISNSRQQQQQQQYYSNGPAQKEPFDLSNNENMWRPW